MNAPTFKFDRGMATTTWADPPVEFQFSGIRSDRRSGDLTAELAVYVGSGQSRGLLHRAKVNASSTRGQSEFSNHLDRRQKGPDWSGMLEVACWRMIEASRRGDPAILLRDAAPPAGDTWILPPLALSRLPVILFGDGGAAKSYVVLAAALSIHTGQPYLGITPSTKMRVAFLDWEFSAWEHRERMRRIVGDAELPDLCYVRCSMPLREEIDRLRGIIREFGIEYVIIDSIGFACEGPPEEAQSALGFFEGLRQLEVGALCTAHVNRMGDTERPFGSTFWHNGARATWYVKKTQATGPSGLAVGLFNRKSNTGPLSPPIGFEIDFAGDQTTFSRRDVRDVPGLAAQLPLKAQVASALRAGPLTYHELAEELGAPVDSIIQAVRRSEGKLFTKLTHTDDSVHRVALLTRQEVN